MGLAQAGDPPDPEGGGTRRRSTGHREAPTQRLTQHPLRHEVQVVQQYPGSARISALFGLPGFDLRYSTGRQVNLYPKGNLIHTRV